MQDTNATSDSGLRAILVDDENHSIQTLEYELSRHCPEVRVVTTCQSGQEAVAAILQFKPDLLFLDIEMPGMNGFQVLKEVGTLDFEVILVTAYDQYAIQAFRFAAIDYLLKPIIAEDLKEAVQRVLNKKEKSLSDKQIKTLIYNLQADHKHRPRIALPHGNALDFVSVDEIIRCQADSNYSHVFLQNGHKYFLAKTLREMVELLEPHGFYRCHQSHLVNLQAVKRFVKSDGGYVIMTDSSQVPISRRRAEKFNQLMKE
ncbi:MAG: LytTR family DNA-binding domain-containing protein [Saprospiraceae bacterium]|nr:LytTR family DNA-binding domain-containing protein [Saprospiraceae bacterium]